MKKQMWEFTVGILTQEDIDDMQAYRDEIDVAAILELGYMFADIPNKPQCYEIMCARVK